jgi:hypothetical protein
LASLGRARAICFVFVAGCYAAPPPPALSGQLVGCHPGAYATLSEHPCDSDSDCLLCGTEDGCELVPRARVAVTNQACPSPTHPRCEGEQAACCEGRCVRSLPPPF